MKTFPVLMSDRIFSHYPITIVSVISFTLPLAYRGTMAYFSDVPPSVKLLTVIKNEVNFSFRARFLQTND